MKRVVLLATALTGAGGIQRFNRLLVQALSESCREQGGSVDVLALADHEVPDKLSHCVSARVFGSNRLAFAAAALAAAARSDVVLLGHSNFLPLALPIQAAARLRRQPRVALVVHGIEAWDRWARSSRWAARRVDRLVAVSRYTAERCAAANDLRHVAVAVLPDALDPAFEPALKMPDTARPNAGPRLLLTVSRLGRGDEYKGVDTVIRALPAVLAACSEARLVVIGDGSLIPELRALADSLGVSGAVQFRGWVSDEQLTRAYAECAVFVLPSAGEGFGLTHLEAMAFGRPVVGARAGATPEVVCDGTTGLLVPYGSAPALADALIRLLADDKLRGRLGAAGRARVAEGFTYKHLAARTRQIIATL